MAKKKTSKKRVSAKKPSRKSSTKRKKPSEALAIVGLILNILILPGLGSIVGGRTKEGVWQIVLLFGSIFVGIAFTLTIIGAIIGIPLIIFGPLGAWIWSIVTGIQMITEATK